MTTADRILVVAERFLTGAGQVDREVAQMQILVITEQANRHPEAIALDLACELVKTKAALAAARRPQRQL